MDIKQKILDIKGDTAILAHLYQDVDIIDIADLKGDSYKLAKEAQKLPNKRVVVCGVRFMAETVKILSPEKEVILANPKAGCPMADMATPSLVRELKEGLPDVPIVAYVNTSAETKAYCDMCVTSSSALRILKAMPQKDIVFLPDRNLGDWLQRNLPEKNLIIWDGYCPVHDSVFLSEAKRAKRRHSDAVLAVHPECDPEVCEVADMVGATSDILNYIVNNDKPVVIGTERGVYDFVKRHYPEKQVYQLCENKLVCKDMKLTTLDDVFSALKGDGGEVISIDEKIRISAKKCLDNMIKYGG